MTFKMHKYILPSLQGRGLGVGLLLACFLLTGCGLYKNYERPADLRTDGLYGSAQVGNTEQSLGAKAWREFFTDPTLQALIERGLSQNANMRQVDLQIQEAQAYLKVAKLAYIPSLSLAPQGQLSSMDWNKPLKFYSVPLTATWQIGSLGSLRNAKKSAQVALEQSKTVRQAVQQNLVSNIANLYYTLCSLDAQMALSQSTAKNWRQSVEMTKKLMEAGRSNKAAVSQTEANCLSVEASVLDLEDAIRQTENALCTILGEAPHHIERTSLASFQAPAVIETGIPLALLQNRPDVKQAELQLASAFYAVNSATANFFPSLTISGTLGFTNNGGALELSPGQWIWNALGQLLQPIFQNGRLRAQKKVAKLKQEEAKIAFQQSLVAAGNEVNSALASLQTAEAKKSFMTQQVAALTEAVQATQALYKDNVSRQVNYLNVLTAQTGLLNAQMGQIGNDLEAVQATIDLYQALGGGSITEATAQ